MRPIFLLWCIVFAASCHQVPQIRTKPDARPNILFIMSDDHTSQAWGIYGGILADYVQNKHIKQLAKEGVVVRNAFCTNSICTPSRASILSGQYSHRNGVYDLNGAFHPDSLNVSKLLQQNGYETALFGKWHLQKEPTGFDAYMVLSGQGQYHNPLLKTKDNWQEGEAGGTRFEGYTDDVITDQVLNWLKNRRSGKPFFLNTHFKAPHEPFDYPARYAHFLENQDLPYPPTFEDWGAATTGRAHDGWHLEILGARFAAQTGSVYPGTSFSLAGLDSLAARKKIYQKLVKDFLRAGAAIDENLGKIIAYLKETGEYDNTLIVYTADQGYFLGEHGFFDKRFIYEESLRMPLVIVYPKEFRGGTSVDDLILNIDFPSLFLDLAGVPQPPSMQGRSFRTNLQGKTPSNWRKATYYRYWANESRRPAHFGIRTERYKLAFFYGQSRMATQRDKMKYPPAWEFYDLQNDPREQHNAIHDPQYATLIRELKQQLWQLKAQVGDSDANDPQIRRIIAENY